MYSGFSKSSGDVIGRVKAEKPTSIHSGHDNRADVDVDDCNDFDGAEGEDTSNAGLEVLDAAGTMAAEESFLAFDSSSGQQVGYRAYLDHIGEVSWSKADDVDHVLTRTVSMSQMTSMLRDSDRCNLYEKALSICISNFIKTEGRCPQVLDIGTGTGLLAMLAVKHGAEHVVGCEMFKKMASIAEAVVDENSMADKINVFPDKSSAYLQPPFADIIVSELLDSALLGESCVYSHADAIDRLYNGDTHDISTLQRRVIPHSSEVYATLVQSEDVKNFRNIDNVMMLGCSPYRDNYSSNKSIEGNEDGDESSSNSNGDGGNYSGDDDVDHSSQKCFGGSPLIPVHWKEIERLGGRYLSDTKGVMSVEFFHGSNDPYNISPKDDDDVDEEDGEEGGGKEEINFRSSRETSFEIRSEGMVHGVLIWWDLNLLSKDLDPNRECVYSTSPDSGLCWQDHWVQVVYPLSQPILCKVGDVLVLKCFRNDIQMWFDVSKTDFDSSNSSDSSNNRSNISSGGDGNNASSKKARTDTHSSKRDDIPEVALVSSSGDYSDTKAGGGADVGGFSDGAGGASARNCNCMCKFEEPRPCDCGWHMLFGAEKIHMMNDAKRKEIWEYTICKLGSQFLELLNEVGEESEEIGENRDASEVFPDEVSILQHPHSLSKRICSYANSAYGCDICGQTGFGLVFNCEGCGFDAHPQCVKPASSLKSSLSSSSSVVCGGGRLKAVGQSKLLALDVGDGSILSIGLSKYLKSSVQGEEGEEIEIGGTSLEDRLAVVSVERKEFSRLFFNGLVNSNDLYGLMSVWDGIDGNDLSYFTSADEDEDENEEQEKEEERIGRDAPIIHLLLSECFYFQLNSLPIWEAISFYHRRRALADQLHPRAAICPCAASVMVAAVELPDLFISHGIVTSASGFAHSSLDMVQANWHSYVFPYRVASYRHSLLTEPIEVATFDYISASHSVLAEEVNCVANKSGAVHGLVMWVDYHLLPNDPSSILRTFDGDKFPFSYKTNIRFVPTPVEVNTGDSVAFLVSYELGKSEVSVSLKPL